MAYLMRERLSTISLIKLQRWVDRLFQFFAGQFLLQILTVFSGIALIRLMSKEDYADFSIAFAFQATMGVLIDIGFSNSIVALVQDRQEDVSVIRGYVRAALSMRKKTFLALSLIGMVVYMFIQHNNKTSFGLKLLTYSGIVFYIYNQKYVIYLSIFRIKGLMKDLYTSQIVTMIGRIAVLFALYYLGALTGWIAIWIGGLQCAILGITVGRKVRQYVESEEPLDPKYAREMLAFIKPQAPGVIFYAFQGQVALGIIAYFGNPSLVAETAALSRLNQLFMLVSAFSSVIIEPYFARLPKNKVVYSYLLITSAYAIFGLSAFLVSRYYASGILWILGAKYSGLEIPLQLNVIGGSVGQLTVLFWILNQSRHWNQAWIFWLIIASTVIVQIVAVKNLDISTVVGVSWFQLWAALSALIIHFGVGIFGMIRLRRNPNAIVAN